MFSDDRNPLLADPNPSSYGVVNSNGYAQSPDDPKFLPVDGQGQIQNKVTNIKVYLLTCSWICVKENI